MISFRWFSTDATTRRSWRATRVKLNPQKRTKSGTRLKTLTPDKLLTRLPILLAQIKAGTYKLKNWNKTNIMSFASAK